MKLQEVYNELKQLNLCKSAYDFSVEYLGRDRSYYSVLKSTNTPPSIEALVMLDFALTQNVKELGNSDHPVIERTHTAVERMSSEIKQAINDKCRMSIKTR
jgi:hypothetical protein